jgi:hypothetical protein
MRNAMLVILMLLLGCTAATKNDVAFSALARGDDAPGITGRLNDVITDPVTFENFWKDIYHGADTVPDKPKVDFAKDMVIAVSPGRIVTGGYSVEIVRVEDKGTRLDVTILMKHASGRDDVLTQPYDIIRLEKKNVPVVYKWVEQ